MGIIGLGQGAASAMPAMEALPETALVAGADPNERMRSGFVERFAGTRAYATVSELCADKEIDAVWVATPNKYHRDHAVEAMRAGKHVLVEKPMAVTLAEADEMVEAARANGVHLLAAHTSSYGVPIRVMRKIAQDELGTVRSILIWSYTDWMLRARTGEELSLDAGSGIVHRQSPHQIDALRLLGGGLLRSVRGMTGQWMPERPIPGFYTAYLEFADGTPATIVHNGYGYFMHGELFAGALDGWRYTEADRIALRKEMRTGKRDEEREKEKFRIGGTNDPTKNKNEGGMRPWGHPDVGMIVVSCDRGDMRQAKYGVMVYGDTGARDVDVRGIGRQDFDLEGGATVGALLEMYDAVVNGVPVYHSGAWGRATLEATLAIVQSAHDRREIMLERQVEMPAAYDAALDISTGAATAR
jgi:phthalate 4,5-cis-dihydrodiol dehydrogenase